MKHFLFAVLVAAGFVTKANATPKVCFDVADIAIAVMEERQKGVPASIMLEAAARVPAPYLKDMVQDAMRTPLLTDETAKFYAVREFHDRWVAACLQVFGTKT